MSESNFSKLFPGLPKKAWKKVDLNEAYLNADSLEMKYIEDQDVLLKIVSEEEKCYTYGGFLENRGDMWNEFYGKEYRNKKLWHLGVDFNNLPVGQPVASLADGLIKDVLIDKDKFNGWGGRLIIYYEIPFQRKNQEMKHLPFFVLYGHLDPTRLVYKVGDTVKEGDIIGYVGHQNSNGGWFPHLHLQVMNEDFVQKFKNMADIDGYIIAEAGKEDTEEVMQYTGGVLDPVVFLDILQFSKEQKLKEE